MKDLDVANIEQALQMGLKKDEFERAVQLLQRVPNMLELGIFSAMWSEHCSYKSSRIHLKKFSHAGVHVLVGPGENAGIVDVGDNLAVVFKVESHNHPSFIEPFQGAATGMGGILRDVFTMGARPFATMNLLRFGTKNHFKTKHLLSGVVKGISGYGNCFGVSNVVSDVAFDQSYNENILVNAFAIGVVQHDKIFLGTARGLDNPVFYVGAKTGKDGIHGATMASDEFNGNKDVARPTVQVGDPFKEKLLFEACLECFSKNILVGIQDMGAAGLTSSSFEMAYRGQSGLFLHLDRVPLREKNMTPYEIMLSESQERMLLVVKKGKEQILIDIFSRWDLDAVNIGGVTGDGIVRLFWHGEEYAALSPKMLIQAAPVYNRFYETPILQSPSSFNFSDDISCQDLFLKLVTHPDLSNQNWITEQYDRHIGLGTLQHQHQADAALVQIPGSSKAVALQIGCDSRLCGIDPREGAKRTLARLVLQTACVGASPIGLSNCLNYGSPEDATCMWQLVSSIEGLAEAAEAFKIPVISGNVSLYNQTDHKPICPTPTIALVSLQETPTRTATISYKNEGDLIVYIGSFADQFSGAELLWEGPIQPCQIVNILDLIKVSALAKTLIEQVKNGNVLAAAHVGKGGLLYTIFKMAHVGKKGAHLQFDSSLSQQSISLLFSEDAFGVVISVSREKLGAIERAFSNIAAIHVLGTVASQELTCQIAQKKLLQISMNTISLHYDSGLHEVVNGQIDS
jgi:phosphoribosylformylglycinamidine synthase subunit PurL